MSLGINLFQILQKIDTPKSNSKFVLPLLHEEELIVKEKVPLLKGKKHSCQGKCY